MNKIEFKPIFITAFFVFLQLFMYKIVGVLQRDPIILGSMLDDNIPFNVIGIIPYCLWYILLFLVPYIFYKKDKKDFALYISLYFIMNFIADIIYLVYPTTVIRPEITQSGLLYDITRIVFNIDTPIINCLPSLHCAIATLWVIMFIKRKYPLTIKLPIILISILVIPSTLIIKQHVIIDATLGIIYAIVIYFIVKRISKVQDIAYKNLKL